jgi:predicted DNA-binding transcriptional regulator YafY
LARTTRLFALLQLLRGRKRPITAAALADELGISERTVYRDIAELSAQGAPIEGEAGLGYVLRPGLFLPPLMLGGDETEAIVLGLRYVDQRGDDILSHAAREALAKVGAVLSPAAQEALRNPVALPGPGGLRFPENTVELRWLRAAIKAQAKLEIVYEDAAGARTRRIVWPLALGFANEARVLMAWCETREAYRTFRTDRIAAAERRDRYPGHRTALLAEWRAAMDAEAVAPDKI